MSNQSFRYVTLIYSLQNEDADITLDYEDALLPTGMQQEAWGARATSEAANNAIDPVS